MNKSFVFDDYFFKAIGKLSGNNYKKCMKAIINYAFYDISPPNDNITQCVFSLYKDVIDDRKKKSAAEHDRHSKEYLGWKQLVFSRDNYKCQICGSTNKLNAHHIKSFMKYPNERFDVNNGVTLCEKCHKEVHSLNGR